MNRCGDCKFWGRKGEDGKFRSCTGVIHDESSIHDEEVGDWMDEEYKESVIRINALPAVVVDGSGYFAALKTKEDFGCVLFERREV